VDGEERPEVEAEFQRRDHVDESLDCVGTQRRHRRHHNYRLPATHTRRGVVVSGVRRMNEFNARWAWLVLGWVTVFGRVYHLGV